MATRNIFDVGETAKLTGTFRNEAGDLTTPTTTTLYLERPDGTVETVVEGSLTLEGTGVYSYLDTVDARGVTRYRWVGVTGSNTVVEEDLYYGRQQHAVPSA